MTYRSECMHLLFIIFSFQTLPFLKIAHSITAQDHQPTPDSCIMSMVVGQLKVSIFHSITVKINIASFLNQQLNSLHARHPHLLGADDDQVLGF